VDEVVAAEKLAAEAYQFRHGRPHPCLSEHDQCGLPRPEEVLSLLQDIGYPHAVFDNAPLDVWLPMMILSGKPARAQGPKRVPASAQSIIFCQ